MGGLGHGIFCTFMGDRHNYGEGETKITPSKIITEGGGGLETRQRKN